MLKTDKNLPFRLDSATDASVKRKRIFSQRILKGKWSPFPTDRINLPRKMPERRLLNFFIGEFQEKNSFCQKRINSHSILKSFLEKKASREKIIALYRPILGGKLIKGENNAALHLFKVKMILFRQRQLFPLRRPFSPSSGQHEDAGDQISATLHTGRR